MRVEGLSAIAGRFDGMLIDQFGVLHDGEKLYPGTRNVMLHLKAAGVPAVIMTNSGKRAAANRHRIERLGLPRELFVDAISSGEMAYARVAGRRAFIIGKEGEDYGFDTVVPVGDPALAEVILILGSNAPRTSLDDYRTLLRGLTVPAVCCNPDRLMLTPGGLQPAPGAIAAIYEELGGRVTWIGKPYPEIYAYARGLIPQAREVLCIGDSAAHDVAGAKAAGLASLLVMTGVSDGIAIDSVRPQPDYWMERFAW